MITGIYKITAPDGKVYVGQAFDIVKRWRRYQTRKLKQHRLLYNSALKFGIDNHTFEIIHECGTGDLNTWERYYQDLFDVCGLNGLNCRLTTTVDKPGSFREESKKLISISSKGKIMSPEAKKKISAKIKGKKRTEESKARTRVALSKVEFFHNQKLMVDVQTGIFFESIKEAAYAIGIKTSTLENMLRGQVKNRTNIRYAYPQVLKVVERAKAKIISPSAKGMVVVDMSTGIFFNSVKDAAECFGYKKNTLNAMLIERNRNRTNLIYA